MTGHDGLGILLSPEPGHVREDAVLVDPRGQTRPEDHDHEEAEIGAHRDMFRDDGGERQQGEHGDIDEQREADSFWVGGTLLDLCEDIHRAQIGDGRYGQDGGLVVGSCPVV